MKLIANPQDRDSIDMTHTMYPTVMTCRTEAGKYLALISSTTYAICYRGDIKITPWGEGPSIHMVAGTVACFWGAANISSVGDFKLFLIEKLGYRGLQMSAQCEKKGRLAYIDGCSDTTLLPPARYGDPALNYLHFPSNIDQTQHLHPDIRMGVVLGGRGVAWQGDKWKEDMTTGSMFCLDESEIHSFRTKESSMDVIAYHPTTDTGPTDAAHAMISRTYINHGKS